MPKSKLSLAVALLLTAALSCVTPPRAPSPGATAVPPSPVPPSPVPPSPVPPPSRPATPGRGDSTRGDSTPGKTSAPDAAPPALPREFRAAWVSPLADGHGPDWPSAPGLSADSQKTELRALLDAAQAIGLNAVVLHVRLAGDALYPTPLAPWSAFLSGRSGVAPSPYYDPLAYAVEQAHARGLQLHAWFNPFRAMLPNFASSAAAAHVTRLHRDWIRKYGTQTWIDPGDPTARQAVLATILDVVRRYDVDGVHIDDYFYPYRETETIHRRRHHRRITIRREIAFPDDRTWKRYGRARGWTDRAAWRRANIDDFVERMYAGVKQIKPWVLVGISPFGIWKSGTPPGVTGLDAYGEIYADSRRWLREGWLDYLVPQLYWPVDGAEHRFTRLEAWWQAEDVRGRHVWPGLETDRTRSRYDAWPQEEIAREVDVLRTAQRTDSTGGAGHVHFRLGALVSGGTESLGGRLHQWVYGTPALVPASPWLGAISPASPRVWTDGTGAGAALDIAAGDSTPVAWWLVQTRDANGRWTSRLEPGAVTRVVFGGASRAAPAEVAITALSRTGLASAATRQALPVASAGNPWPPTRW